jgi:alpha-mannosidase
LIKSGVFPDFFADEGLHHFSYAIYPHQGQDLLPTIQQAHAFNSPFFLHEGTPAFPFEIRTISDPNLKVLAMKKSIDGTTVVRLAEMTGGSGQASIVFSQVLSKVSKTTILEDEIEILERQNRAFTVDYRPFEILTLKLWQ